MDSRGRREEKRERNFVFAKNEEPSTNDRENLKSRPAQFYPLQPWTIYRNTENTQNRRSRRCSRIWDCHRWGGL